MLDFYSLVKEALLLEDPDTAKFNPDHLGGCDKDKVSWETFSRGSEYLDYQDEDAFPFFVYNATPFDPVPNGTAPVPGFFISLAPSVTHADLRLAVNYNNVAAPHKSQQFICGDNMQRIIDSAKAKKQKPFKYDFEGGTYIIAGRVWRHSKQCLIAMWSYGKIEDMQRWLKANIKLINPANNPMFIQLPHYENSAWTTWEEFSGEKAHAKTSPEIEAIVKQLNDLAPQLHLTTGPVKERIRFKIEELRLKYKELIGDTTEDYDLRGSAKYAKQAGDKTPAEIRSKVQTSESINNVC